MTIVCHRHRLPKPPDGHFSLFLPQGATVVSYTEYWHVPDGWQIALDVVQHLSRPGETRHFFLCNNDDALDFIDPENPDLYMVGQPHQSKAYTSYLFETTHLTPGQRELGKVKKFRYTRGLPHDSELPMSVRKMRDDYERDRDRRKPLRAVEQPPAVGE